MTDPSTPWWQSRRLAFAAIVLSAIPLLYPAFPPLGDVPAHIGRYHVALDLARSPDLQRHWTYRWALVGNLGVDLLVMALGQFCGVVTAAKIVIMTIPPLTIAGWLWLSREIDGRLSPAAGFALPLAYAYPFQMGFVNFALAAALAILALALWIRWGRQRRLWSRLAWFVPISWMLWICHSFGWGLFGLFAFAADVARLRGEGKSWWQAGSGAVAWCLPLATPAIAMAAIGNGGVGLGWSWEPVAKVVWLIWLFNERWKWWDIGCAVIVYVALYLVARHRGLTFQPLLLAFAGIAAISFLVLPKLLLGGGYVDVRMLPIALALALVSARTRGPDGVTANRLALAATAFFVMRMAVSTAAFALFADAQATALEVTPHIPRGAGVLVLVDHPCADLWNLGRMEHLGGIALAQRDLFVNSEWTIPGQQLLRDRHPKAAPFNADPSQFLDHLECVKRPKTTLAGAMRTFDRATFQYVWTIGLTPRAALAPDVHETWSNGVSTLYVVQTARR